MQGKIIRGIAGFYYVNIEQKGIIECKAKGIFRNRKEKPLVGDDVEIEILDEEKKAGNIITILPRKNRLIRPAVAMSYPKPNLNLLDRFWLSMEQQEIPTIICFNKSDDCPPKEAAALAANYEKSGITVFITSTKTGDGIADFRKALSGKTTVFAGPSGVGKSSVMNTLFPEAKMETGEISEKIKRGKHTTRHSELFYLGEDTYVMDTPGFTSLELPKIEKEEIKDYYPEFMEYRDQCRFLGCVHIHEPDCCVKEALEQGMISKARYENYKQFYEEISTRRKY